MRAVLFNQADLSSLSADFTQRKSLLGGFNLIKLSHQANLIKS